MDHHICNNSRLFESILTLASSLRPIYSCLTFLHCLIKAQRSPSIILHLVKSSAIGLESCVGSLMYGIVKKQRRGTLRIRESRLWTLEWEFHSLFRPSAIDNNHLFNILYLKCPSILLFDLTLPDLR